MSTAAKVRLWGRDIGVVALRDNADVAEFEYVQGFADSGVEVAPLMMPVVARQVYRFPALSRQTFRGLPGLLADSLPDSFGDALVDAWLAQQGRARASFNVIAHLCYTGSRGMGALEFVPDTCSDSGSSPVYLDGLVQLASDVLRGRQNMEGVLTGLPDLLKIGGSAGGVRPKVVIAWHPGTGEIRSGQVKAEPGFEYWQLKLDGVSDSRDRESGVPQGFGSIEYAYHKMAIASGVDMSKCRLHEENGRRHFMTLRFDRTASGAKLHMQSWCALAHYDFNMPGVYSYEQLLRVIKQLNLPQVAVEEQFRRMVFNVMARNQDDHVKNVAFLMNKSGDWSLAPAFDVTYSHNPAGVWTSKHQLMINAKSDGLVLQDLKACANTVSMKRGRVEAIIAEVQKAVSGWRDYADDVGVAAGVRDEIFQHLRLRW